MAYRDKEWYERAIKAQEEIVEKHRADLARSIELAEFSAAAMKCDDLKASLTKLNDLSNHYADKWA